MLIAFLNQGLDSVFVLWVLTFRNIFIISDCLRWLSMSGTWPAWAHTHADTPSSYRHSYHALNTLLLSFARSMPVICGGKTCPITHKMVVTNAVGTDRLETSSRVLIKGLVRNREMSPPGHSYRLPAVCSNQDWWGGGRGMGEAGAPLC